VALSVKSYVLTSWGLISMTGVGVFFLNTVYNDVLFSPGLIQLCYVQLRLDRLCGLVVRVLGYRSGCPGSIPCTTRKKK
jgi:hypothetical protein